MHLFNINLKDEQGNWVIDPEFFRFVGYVNFWIMVAISIIVTKATVVIPSPNPLEEIFGYTNICIYFDYDPARVVASMLYPLVEFSLVLYVVTNWYAAKDTFRCQGEYAYIIFSLATFVEVVAIAWFRMVFVVRVFTDVVGHTLPFIGLMIALSMIAIQNTIYYNLLNAKTQWKCVGWFDNFKQYFGILAWGYTILLFIGTAIKVIFTTAVFLGHPIIPIGSPGQVATEETIDYLWMILAAVMPMGFSIYLMTEKNRPKLTFGPSFNLYRMQQDSSSDCESIDSLDSLESSKASACSHES